jgi:hypothetical protein
MGIILVTLSVLWNHNPKKSSTEDPANNVTNNDQPASSTGANSKICLEEHADETKDATCQPAGGNWVVIRSTSPAPMEGDNLFYSLNDNESHLHVGCSSGWGQVGTITVNVEHPTRMLKQIALSDSKDDSSANKVQLESVLEGHRTVSFISLWEIAPGRDPETVTLRSTGEQDVLAYNIAHSGRIALLGPSIKVVLQTKDLDESAFASDCLSPKSLGQQQDIEGSTNVDTPIGSEDASKQANISSALFDRLVQVGWPLHVADAEVTRLLALQSAGSDLSTESRQNFENTETQ